MNRRNFLKELGREGLFLNGLLAFPGLAFSNRINYSNLEEYCFSVSSDKSVAMRDVDTTPEQFLKNNPNVEAAINGPYYGPDNKTEGIAYLADNWHFATEKPEDIRGYFSVNSKGDEIKVSESLKGSLNDYFMVLGTHPLLVTDGKVNNQAYERRYGDIESYRSAIGTKTGKDICFAVSTDKILMKEWAERLEGVGYYGALNLDGGPISQMAIRNNENEISVKGEGRGNTKLVLFSYRR